MLQETIIQDALLQDVPAASLTGTFAGSNTCPNCQTLKVGRFCHQCGSEGIDKHEFSLKHFLHHSLHEFTHIEDSKVLRTLKYLLVKPGKLTTEYFAGRKIRYLSPIRMFLIIFALTFYVYSAFKTISIYDAEVMSKTEPQLSIKIDALAQKKNLTRTELIQAINQKWHRYTSFSQLSYVVLFALILKMAFRKRFLVEHLVFSLHFLSFSLLLSVLFWPLYLFTGGVAQNTANMVLGAFSFLLTGAYLAAAIKEIFSYTWGRAALHASWMTLAYYVVYMLVYTATFALAIRNAA